MATKTTIDFGGSDYVLSDNGHDSTFLELDPLFFLDIIEEKDVDVNKLGCINPYQGAKDTIKFAFANCPALLNYIVTLQNGASTPFHWPLLLKNAVGLMSCSVSNCATILAENGEEVFGNFYLLGVGPSGCGKTYTKDRFFNTMTDVEGTTGRLLIINDCNADSIREVRKVGSFATNIVRNEFGGIIDTISKGSGNSGTFSNDQWLEAFDSRLVKIVRVSKGLILAEGHWTIVSDTQPERLYPWLNSVKDTGWVRRLSVFFAESIEEYQTPKERGKDDAGNKPDLALAKRQAELRNVVRQVVEWCDKARPQFTIPDDVWNEEYIPFFSGVYKDTKQLTNNPKEVEVIMKTKIGFVFKYLVLIKVFESVCKSSSQEDALSDLSVTREQMQRAICLTKYDIQNTFVLLSKIKWEESGAEQSLTDIQRKVLVGLRQGMSQACIARDLGVSEVRINAVKKQLHKKGIDTTKGGADSVVVKTPEGYLAHIKSQDGILQSISTKIGKSREATIILLEKFATDSAISHDADGDLKDESKFLSHFYNWLSKVVNNESIMADVTPSIQKAEEQAEQDEQRRRADAELQRREEESDKITAEIADWRRRWNSFSEWKNPTFRKVYDNFPGEKELSDMVVMACAMLSNNTQKRKGSEFIEEMLSSANVDSSLFGSLSDFFEPAKAIYEHENGFYPKDIDTIRRNLKEIDDYFKNEVLPKIRNNDKS